MKKVVTVGFCATQVLVRSPNLRYNITNQTSRNIKQFNQVDKEEINKISKQFDN